MAHEFIFRSGAKFPGMVGGYARPLAVAATGLVVFDDYEHAGSFVLTEEGHGYTSASLLSPLTVTCALAKADNVSTIETIGVLTEVIDEDTIRVKQVGKLTMASHGLTVGEVYFVSAATAGEITSTPPGSSGQFIKPIFKVIDTNTIEIVDYPAVEVGSDASYYVPTPPAHSNSTGTQGQWSYDSGYYYKCVAANVWYKVAAITSF